MNQILVSKKVYVTPKLRRKKKLYKIQFVLSILVVIVLSGYVLKADYDTRKGEATGKEILKNISNDDNTVVEEVPTQPLDKFNTIYKTENGTEYKVDSVLNIPSLDINYPVLSDTSTELLKISLNKFWGGDPNSVGNYCIVGHNYDGKDIFFGKLHKLQNGDIVELEDKTGKVLQYKVYNKFIVQPTDVACTSQLTNGKKEMTLITCSDGGKTRLIVKCRELPM